MDIHDVREATVVGWSMGCTVVLSSMQAPSPRVGRIVVMNGPLRLTRTADFPHALTDEELHAYVEGMERTWPADQRGFLQDSLLATNVAMTPLLEYVAWQTPLHIALRLVRNQARIDHRLTVRDLPVPILAAYSIHDPYWPVDVGRWIADNAPRGHLHTFTESAHCAPLEEPAEFVRVITDFAAGRFDD